MSRVRYVDEEGVVEVMHAQARSDGLFVLDNSPFYVYGISCGDVFSAANSGDELVFERVVERGGHSKYRVRLNEGDGHESFERRWKGLEYLGCTYEGSDLGARRLYSIDVPPSASLEKVYELLEEGEMGGAWQFEEAYCHIRRV